MSLFDDVKKNLMEWYTVSSDKTAEVARITTRRYDKFGISRDIERQFGELGSLVFSGMKEGRQDLLTDPGVIALVERIKGLEEELRIKNEEIEKIRDEFHQRRSSAAEAGAASEGVQEQTVVDGPEEGSAVRVETVAADGEAPPAGEAVSREKAEGMNPEMEG